MRDLSAMFIASFILLIMVYQAQACEVVVHTNSYHTDRELIKDVNEVNPGLGCKLNKFEFGVYKDSYSELNSYVLYDTTNEGFGSWIGLSNGYENEPTNFGPVTIIGGGAFHGERFIVRVTPSYNVTTEETGLVLGLSWRM